MNSISRAIHTRICLLSRRLLLLQSHFSTTAAKPQTPNTHTVTRLRFKSKPPQPPNPDLLPRPTQVPFQPKVANWVRLIGQVRTPLHVVRTPDGKVLAATVLTSSSPSPANYLRKMIPIVFEGDLAHTADLHLKDGAFVFVAGSLRSDLDHLNAGEDQGRLQVKPNSPDFKRKERGHALWLNKAPHSVLSELEGVEFDVQIQKSKQVNESKASLRNDGDCTLGSWSDLLSNPKQWWDCRSKKLNGLRKEGGHALWLNKAPQSVLSELEGVEFDVQIPRSKQVNESKDPSFRSKLSKTSHPSIFDPVARNKLKY